jgi:hypothetical protein
MEKIVKIQEKMYLKIFQKIKNLKVESLKLL